MLQKRIKIPSKKIISPKIPLNKSKKVLKNIPKAESAKKNQNLNPDLLINEFENNNQKNATITTETNTTVENTKRIYIYRKNLGKQKNTLVQKNSNKSILRVVSHDQINSKKIRDIIQ